MASFPVGTTGESPTLSHKEHELVVEWCVDQAKGRVPVVAGAGSNSTAEGRQPVEARREGRRRCGAGGDSLLQQADQEGLYQHFKGDQRRHRHSDHHVQHSGRSIVDINVDTMKRLYELKNIAGVKDATANMARVSQQRMAWAMTSPALRRDITALASTPMAVTAAFR